MAALRRSSDCGEQSLFRLWRDDERGTGASWASDVHDGPAHPSDAPLSWALAALQAYEQGLTPNAAMARADTVAGGSPRARQAFLALVYHLAMDGSGRSLAASLRLRVLKVFAAAALRLLSRPLRRLDRAR